MNPVAITTVLAMTAAWTSWTANAVNGYVKLLLEKWK